VLTPNSKLRAAVTPSKRGKGNKARTANDGQDPAPPCPAKLRDSDDP